MLRGCIIAKLEDEMTLKQIRDSMWASAGDDKYYKMRNPHLTIIPPFTINEDKETKLEDCIEDFDLVGRDVICKGVGVYPSIENPQVVKLDAEVFIYDIRKQVKGLFTKWQDASHKEFVEPHITLFKSAPHSNVKNIDDTSRSRISNLASSERGRVDTEISKVTFDKHEV